MTSPRPSAARRLSALVVNYNSGAYARTCVRSLLHEWRRSGRAAELLEIVVVDNASPLPQAEHLRALEQLGARVVHSAENAGYARGMNLALEHTRGAAKDMVAILNPDLVFLPGSVDALMDWLETHPECGAVDPRAWVDPERVLQLPRNALPTLLDHAFAVAAQISPAACRAYSERRLARALPWWTSAEPLEAEMLSGCCVFLRREVLDDVGPLLDPRYPLYYEDTDLFMRLRGRGYRLVHHTDAHVLHHWSRSSGVGGAFSGEPQRRYEISQQAYFRRFYGPLGWALVDALNRAARAWPAHKSFRPMHALQELGAFAEPVELRLPRATDFLLEFGMAPTWLLAVGVPGSGDHWVCPRATWEWFFQADYFVRALDRRTHELLGAWHFSKSVPGRDHPLSEAEMLALEARA